MVQVDAYQRDGHLHCPGVLSPAECAGLRAAVGEAVARTEMAAGMAVPMASREPGACRRGRSGHLDAPYCISVVFIHTTYSRGRLNDSTAHG